MVLDPSHALPPEAPDLSDLVERFDHLALAVNEIRAVLPLMDLLGATYRNGGHHPTQRFRWAQFSLSLGPKLELLQPLDPDNGANFLVRFLASKGEGPHHVTFKVTDLRRAVAAARDLEYEVVGESFTSPEWKEAFVHPRSSYGLLIQLAEWNDSAPLRHMPLDEVLDQPGSASYP
jgi:methylmalonyl-CoA/ethylmalonyl-CoA epimerase